MSFNKAAWIEAAKSHPFVIKDAPTHKAGPNEVLVQNKALAINPVEWKVQDYDPWGFKYPFILGCDVAGDIVEVGEGVTHLHKGQRVLGHAIGLATQQLQHGAFQNFTAIPASFCAPLPDSISYAAGSVLPLGTSTAAHGLFGKDHLGLSYPRKDAAPTGSTVLIWGGSSSVGSCAIQLAVAAGYEVVATAGAKNTQYVRDLGAAHVFDHAASGVVDEIVKVLQGKKVVGAYDTIGSNTTTDAVAKILKGVDGAGTTIARSLPVEGNGPEGVKVVPVFAPAIQGTGIDVAVYTDFLPEALADGRMKPKPDPKLAGEGLEALQGAVDLNKKGVSAAKLVVTL